MNLHITHLEDLVFDYGINGLTNAYSLLVNRYYYSWSIKYDGAPSFFVGLDPLDNRYFVSTKSIANKSPILYKNIEDIPNTPLGEKLKVVFEECKNINFNGMIYQGDVLWTDDIIYDGEFSIFHPNTLVYESVGDLRDYKLGVAFHTRYFGNNLNSLNYDNDFHENDIKNNNKNLFIAPKIADFKLLCDDYHEEFSQLLTLIKKLNDIVLDEELIPYMKTYMNYKIKNGINHKKFINYVEELLMLKIDSLKTERGKLPWKEKLKRFREIFIKDDYELLFLTLKFMANLKDKIIHDFACNFSPFMTYLLNKNGVYEYANHEGYVTLLNGKYVKLVNRNQFSMANFSDDYVKGFER